MSTMDQNFDLYYISTLDSKVHLFQLDPCINENILNIEQLIAETCQNEDISLLTMTLPTKTYSTTKSVTSSGLVRLNSQVEFKAEQEINLLPGFHVELGSNFVASIENCLNTSNFIYHSPIIFDYIGETNAIPNVDLTIYPNPAETSITVSYSIPEIQNVNIYLYNALGQLEKVLGKYRLQEAGDYNVHYPINNLTNGVYYLNLDLEEYNNKTQKILIYR